MEEFEKDREKFLHYVETTLGIFKEKIKNKLDGSITENKGGKSLAGEKVNPRESYRKAEEVYEKLKNSTENEWDELKHQASEIFESLNIQLSGMADIFSSPLLKDLPEKVSDYSQDKMEQVSSTIKDNPFNAILVAFGIGFAVGVFLRRG